MDQTVWKTKKQILTKKQLKELESKQKQLQIEQKELEIEQRKLEIDQIREGLNDVRSQIDELINELNQLPIGIKKIPSEILITIFGHLDLCDVVKCQQVCRQWQATAQLLKLDSLVIFEKSLEVGKASHWPRSGEVIDPKRSISMCKLNFKCFDSPFLRGLKRLRVQDAVQEPLLIEFINRMTALEELHIAELKSLSKEIRIRLNSLVHLTIGIAPKTAKQIIVHTPNLRQFTTFSGLENLNFVHPHQIRELSLTTSLTFVSQFNGLRLLACNNCRVERHTLKALANLREIHFCNNGYIRNRKTAKRNVLELLELKRELNRTELKIIFHGILLEEAGQLDGCDFEEDSIGLLMRNYNRLNVDQLDWVEKVDFTVLSKNSPANGLPADFHSKFSEIRQVNIRLLDNSLIKFIKDCRKLECLFVSYSSLKTFYSQLEVMPSFVEILAIERKRPDDFNIVLNFYELNPVETSPDLVLDAVQLAWQTIEKIRMIHLKINGSRLQIEKEQTKFVLQFNHGERVETFDHLEAVVRFLVSYSF